MLDGFNTQQHQRRRYPKTADDVFRALVTVTQREYTVKSVDEMTRTVMFEAWESKLTWGEIFTAMVLDAEKGCDLEISGVGKVGGQVQQATALVNTMAHVFEKVSAELSAH